MPCEHSQVAHDVATNQGNIAQNHRSEMLGLHVENVEKPLGSLPATVTEGEKHALLNPPKTTFHPSSNGSLKRDLNTDTMHDAIEGNLNSQRDSLTGDCGPVKRPRLDKTMPSLENELDNLSSIPSRTGSPTPLVNGDIKGDPRNKLMDKLLDKDLRLPLNGVCGIDTSELDLLASDGERLSSSKASSPDLFGSETNSDFGKYLEESDTDTGLFSEVLQGDLRIDPMENGTEGTHPVLPSKIPAFTGGPYNGSGSIPSEKGAPSVIIEQQGKIPFPPAVRLDPQRLDEGVMPGQHSATVNRNAVAVNAMWDSTNTVSQVPKAGYGQQRFAPEVQQKMPAYLQQGNLLPHVGSRSPIQNKESMDPQVSTLAMQKHGFQHQNVQSNTQQVITAQDSAMHPPTVPQNTLAGPHRTGIVNSMAHGVHGAGTQPPSFQGVQQMPSIQTPLSRVNSDPIRGMQPPVWAQSGAQQQQVPIAHNTDAGSQQRVGQVGLVSLYTL